VRVEAPPATSITLSYIRLMCEDSKAILYIIIKLCHFFLQKFSTNYGALHAHRSPHFPRRVLQFIQQARGSRASSFIQLLVADGTTSRSPCRRRNFRCSSGTYDSVEAESSTSRIIKSVPSTIESLRLAWYGSIKVIGSSFRHTACSAASLCSRSPFSDRVSGYQCWCWMVGLE